MTDDIPDEYALRKLRRRNPRRAMLALTSLCAVAALAIGADELHSVGLTSFFDRPPGVGATPPLAKADDSGSSPASTPTPSPTPFPDSAPAPPPALPPSNSPPRPPVPPPPPRYRPAVLPRPPRAP